MKVFFWSSLLPFLVYFQVLYIIFWRGNRLMYVIKDAEVLQVWTTAHGFVPCSKLSSFFSALFLIIPYILSFALCSPLNWHFYTGTYINSRPCWLRSNTLLSATLSSSNMVLWNSSQWAFIFATLNNVVPSKLCCSIPYPSPVHFCKYRAVQIQAQIP